MSFWPFDIPQRGIQSMFRYLQDFRVSSEFLQNTAELRWKLLWCLKWTSACSKPISSLKDFAFQCPTTLVGTVSAAAPTTNTNRLSTASGSGHGHGFPNFWRFSHPSEQLMTGAILGLLSKLGMDKMKVSHYTWLVVSTPLKNISQLNQLGLFFPIYGKVIKFMCQTTKQIPIS